jgi:Uma2 family endonuclease
MSVSLSPPETFAELLERLGGIPLDRIRMQPAPGTATPDDVERLCKGDPKILCELVEGVLVEKPMGHLESRLAFWLIVAFGKYLEANDIGIATGADGPHRLSSGLVRLPDVAFISYDRIPEEAQAATPMPDWIPNLAVEIIRAGNTQAEMDRKRREYFEAGVQVVWIVDPPTRCVRVFTAADQCTVVTEDEQLDGGIILPGFQLSVHDWFERATKLRR